MLLLISYSPRPVYELATTPETTNGGPSPKAVPSLKETLDWLKETLPLGAVHYVVTSGGAPILINEQAAVSSLDSCTAVFGVPSR